MVVLKYSIAFLACTFSIFSYANEIIFNNIKINNTVEKCIIFSPVDTTNEKNSVLMVIKANVEKPTYECGCRSMLLDYSVDVQSNEEPFQVLRSKISVLSSQELLLPLSTDSKLIASRELTINFSCSN
ncbi:DUF2195 family protein [Marinomonas rhizomae]|uniref:DUF2195 family protein n=1 Tax=Marinomonas rhizomae TaxID=491948 RepID=UPI00210455F5|nr:DUF2195 family protein [Marinomonas rhizomae]UTV99849.1 DUF2195 family protein [Marinomonas rhizomae]